jgi:biotin carboxyl carrier protein
MILRPRKLYIEIDGRPETVEILPVSDPAQPDACLVRVGGREFPANARLLQPGVLSLLFAHRSYRCIVDPEPGGDPDVSAVRIGARKHLYRLDDPRSLRGRRARSSGSAGPLSVLASMPGRVVRVLVQPGDPVEENQPLLVIEAMKMQNELKSSKAGRVTELRVAPGEAVAAGQVLAIVE